MKKILLTLFVAVVSLGAMAQNEEMTNETVLQLLKEGFTSEEIIGAIDNSSTRTITFSVDFMRQLKAAGADATLTTYIQKIAKADNGLEGVIWWNTGSKPSKIYRSAFEKESSGFNLGTVAAATVTGVVLGTAISGSKPKAGVGAVTGAGAILLASTGKDVDKLCIMGLSSKNKITTRRPVFRFYLPKKDPTSFTKEADSWYQSIMNSIQSPNEFQLVKMQQKKNRRRFVDGVNFGTMGFETKNPSARLIVDFVITEINNNTFEVSFDQDLEPGEYVFFWKNGLSSEDFKQHVFGFDFCVE